MTPPFDPVDRDGWFRRVLNVAPRLPAPMVSFLSAALADPNASSDSLLWIADTLELAAADSRINGRPHQAGELHAVADLPRQLAPYRAWQAQAPAEPSCMCTNDGTVDGVVERDGTVTLAVPALKQPFIQLRGFPLRLRRRARSHSTATETTGES
jgi:hypothetical protein